NFSQSHPIPVRRGHPTAMKGWRSQLAHALWTRSRVLLNRTSRKVLVHHLRPVLGHSPEEPGAPRFEGLVGDFNVEQKSDAAALEAEFADFMRCHRPEADDARVEPERAMGVVLENIGHELRVAA